MYKLVYVFLIALSGCFTGEQSVAEASTLSNESSSSVITLSIEQMTNYQSVALRLIDIDDSRCPTGETCIWAGQLVVTLEISNEFEEKVIVKLVRKRASELAEAFGYSLLLLDVKPYPKKDKVIRLSEQIVQLKLEKVT